MEPTPNNTTESTVPSQPPVARPYRWLWVGLVAAVVIIIAAALLIFRPTQNSIVRERIGPGTATAAHQAPILDSRVAAGTLPALADRLPTAPVIIQPTERIGVYGGTWHMLMKSTGDHGSFIRTIGYENLVRWNVSWTGIIPNIAQSFDASADQKTFTFHLRPGMRWSDGEPFTADDIMFWYTDVFLREEFSARRPSWLVIAGTPVVVAKVDNETVTFTFAAPYSLFLKILAQPRGAEPTSYPRHYLEQFHIAYNPEANALAKAAGAKDWVELFTKKFGNPGSTDDTTRWQNPALPTLNAWTLTDVYLPTATQIAADRNPFYWKIDTAGNQLPYIDRVEFRVEDDNAKRLAAVYAGQVDMQDRHIGNSFLPGPETRSGLVAHATEGNYALFDTVFASMNTHALSFNLTHKDPVMRSIFQDKNFRIGMSLAIDRPAIIRDFMGGVGIPYQWAPRPESPEYNKTLATQYTEYDPAEANEFLDKTVLARRDAAGYRLKPDGTRFSFVLDWGEKPLHELLRAQWKAVGIEMKSGILDDRAAYYARKNANLLDAGIWAGDGGLDVIEEPRYYFPYSNESNYAVAWAYWFQDPKNPLAQEPPAAVRQQMDIYTRIGETSDARRQHELIQQLLDISVQQFYGLGLSLPDKGFGIVKKNFHNVPKVMTSAFTYPNPAPTNPFQYFIQ